MILNVPGVPPSPNELRRKYRSPSAYKALRTSWENSLAYGCQGTEEKLHWIREARLAKRVMVRVCLYHRRLYDPDNLVGSLKPVLDALVNIGYLKGDSRKHIKLQVEQYVSSNVRTVVQLTAIV